MKKRFVLPFLTLLFLVSAAIPFSARETFADQNPVLISSRVDQKGLISSDFVQRLTSLPEWEPFFNAFTSACDRGLGKELTREKLETKLPKGIVDDLRKAIEKGLTTRTGIEGYFKHVDSILFEIQADLDDFDVGKNVDDVLKLLRGAKKDVEIDVDGFLGAVIDVNPRGALEYLKYLREGKDFEFLLNEPGGDFILRFDFEFHGRDVEFGCAGLKLPEEGRYAVLFSGKKKIVPHYEAFKSGMSGATSTDPKAIKEVVLHEPCFLFIDRQIRRAGLDSQGTEFFSKIKQLRVTFRDVDAVSRIEWAAEMRSAEDAGQVRNLLTGLIAFVQLSQSENGSLNDFLKSVQIDVRENNVSVAVKLDNPELWKLIAESLKKATAEIERKP